MRTFGMSLAAALLLAGPLSPPAAAQSTDGESSRAAIVERSQADKSTKLRPYVPSGFEMAVTRVEKTMLNGTMKWHPFLEGAYTGAGFSPGVGYMTHVSPYSTLDVRGNVSIRNYKVAEAEFISPRLFHRRAELSVVGGWREATQVGFYGIGPNSTTANRADFAFEQPYAGARFKVKPTRRLWVLGGSADVARWSFNDPTGIAPSVDSVYTPATLPGLGITTTFVHSQATVGFDWRPAQAYARRGGFYSITAHDYTDNDSRFGFRRVDYRVTQHFPILRESWVLSLNGQASATFNKDGQQVPFYMLPYLGGGSTLRGYSSHRFRDRDSVLIQGEWRIMVNRFMDTAVFYDAGKVASRHSEMNFHDLRTDYGFGARFHTPFATALRIDVARSTEGTRLVFATSSAF